MNPARLLASLVLAATLAAPARTQTTPITIDADTLNDIRTLTGPFPFEATDDPHFADPTLDDSAWPQRIPNQHVQPIRTSL
jgi:hypothetical protein